MLKWLAELDKRGVTLTEASLDKVATGKVDARLTLMVAGRAADGGSRRVALAIEGSCKRLVCNCLFSPLCISNDGLGMLAMFHLYLREGAVGCQAVVLPLPRS